MTIAALIRHAELFGVECVFETASQNGFAQSELLLLSVELDAIEARPKSRYSVGRRRRRSPDETAELVRLLKQRGLVVPAIADKLGITDAYVRRVLSGSGTAEKAAGEAHG